MEFVAGFQPIMTVVGCVSERTVSTSNLLPSPTPDVSFSGITTENLNSDFKENEKSVRNEVQV